MYPQINKRETGIKLRRIMDKQGVSAKDVQKYLGLGCVQSVYRWLSGESMPTVDNLYALSELFRVSVDELLCGNRIVKVPDLFGEKCTTYERRMYTYYQKLDDRHVA